MKKIILFAGVCSAIVVLSNIFAFAAVQSKYFSLTPPGFGTNVYTNYTLTKTTTNGYGVVKCLKSQDDHYMSTWFSKADKTCISAAEDCWTGNNTAINYNYGGGAYLNFGILLSSDTDGYYGYNYYGYWSPDKL